VANPERAAQVGANQPPTVAPLPRVLCSRTDGTVSSEGGQSPPMFVLNSNLFAIVVFNESFICPGRTCRKTSERCAEIKTLRVSGGNRSIDAAWIARGLKLKLTFELKSHEAMAAQ